MRHQDCYIEWLDQSCNTVEVSEHSINTLLLPVISALLICCWQTILLWLRLSQSVAAPQTCCQQEGKLGHPVSVLLGHAQPVTFLDFCKAVPDVLLSSSMDGTCRIWDAARGGEAKHVLSPTSLFGQTNGAFLLLRTFHTDQQARCARPGMAPHSMIDAVCRREAPAKLVDLL